MPCEATETPKYNPLEKLPVLFDESGKAVYESHFILEWLEVVSVVVAEFCPPQDSPCSFRNIPRHR